MKETMSNLIDADDIKMDNGRSEQKSTSEIFGDGMVLSYFDSLLGHEDE